MIAFQKKHIQKTNWLGTNELVDKSQRDIKPPGSGNDKPPFEPAREHDPHGPANPSWNTREKHHSNVGYMEPATSIFLYSPAALSLGYQNELLEKKHVIIIPACCNSFSPMSYASPVSWPTLSPDIKNRLSDYTSGEKIPRKSRVRHPGSASKPCT